ncbi:MAG TPA: sigma-54 dependent transcriptional regulator [Edaphocola sp.]|nr:sigma-54 dependent transcriptional regulator [Edaphocola sp.]
MKRLLLLSNDALLCKLFERYAKQFSLQTTVIQDMEKALHLLQKGQCEAIVANVPLLSESCPKKIIRRIHEVNAYIPVFIMVDKIDVSEAITLTKLGAEYCYSKPYALEQITDHILNSLKNVPMPKDVAQAVAGSDHPRYLRAKSQLSEHLYKQIDLVADTNFKVVIYGETGTGKESVARRLCNGKYKNKPFVPVDCGCLNRELAGSELFGHVKGSFSGAYSDKKGAFEEANGGTIFLDEIGNLDYSVQILLLRAIEEKKIKRVGSNEEIDIDVRIIAASNEKLSDAVQNGKFREDLYYRLNEFEIVIPPLRERMDDVELFIDFFIDEANRDLGKNIAGVQPDLLEKLKSYDWPGNIRELKNVIRRGSLMATDRITFSCMSSEFLHRLENPQTEQDLPLLNADTSSSSAGEKKESLKAKSIIAEYEEIIGMLRKVNFNKTKAAQRLNINRTTLYNKLRAFHELIAVQGFSTVDATPDMPFYGSID